MKNVWFVYQCWTEDRLYKTGLTREEAYEAQNELNSLIESGACGDGCAVIGCLTDPDELHVCKRLGIETDFYTVQQILADMAEGLIANDL